MSTLLGDGADARFWGKTAEGEPGYHLLSYHSLDVAAVGAVLLEKNPALVRDWSTMLGYAPRDFQHWVTFLLSIHDIGKFAEGFQARVPELFERLRSGTGADLTGAHHTALGDILVRQVLQPSLVKHLAAESRWEAIELEYLLRAWIPPVTGHHGAPPVPSKNGLVLTVANAWDAEGRDAAVVFFHSMLKLHSPTGISPGLKDFDQAMERTQAFSWLLAGFTIACDWLGSNTAFFKPHSHALPYSEYWTDIALPAARLAVRAAGILPAEVAQGNTIQAMFPFILTASPMQSEVDALRLSNGPSLYILEDSTGSGKTEAALLLASRIMSRGEADRLYLGLPTTATADAMHRRLEASSGRFFVDPALASLVVAHGRMRPSAKLGSNVLGESSVVSASTRDDHDGRISSSGWIRDNRKKALLAHIGVGTVDQALLGVLPVRHQALRLYGLARSILIVDEVHAYDEYTATLLDELVSFQARTGGTTILLTATMSLSLRRRLIAAFTRGNGTESGTPADGPFPLLTHVHGGGLDERPVATRGAPRRVGVEFIHSFAAVAATIRELAKRGQSICWIRNTVPDVMDAALELAELEPLVFHAAFTPVHRASIESAIITRVGPESGPKERNGLLVIASQVIEQSLDVDFDHVVTDLAPIDLVIQRAGRLHRHRRNAQGERELDGSKVDGRDPPNLRIFAPPFSETPDETWYRAPFPRASFVYAAHEKLWATQRVLSAEGEIVVPDRARFLMESVYGESTVPVPLGLKRASDRARKSSDERKSKALVKRLRLQQGYVHDGPWDDEDHATTRDGEPTRDVYLAVRGEGGLVPLGAETWADSRISVRARRIATPLALPPEAAQLPDRGRWSAMVEMTPNADGWSGLAKDARGNPIQLTYSERRGLRIEGAK